MVHGKRVVITSGRLLTVRELANRVYAYYKTTTLMAGRAWGVWCGYPLE